MSSDLRAHRMKGCVVNLRQFSEAMKNVAVYLAVKFKGMIS